MANKKPNIRFKGFDEEWVEAKMSTMFNFDTPHNSLSRDKLNDEDGEVQDIHYGDILIKYGSVVDAQKEDIPHITDSIAADYASECLTNGDIIFADTAEDDTAGKAIEIQNIQSKKIVAGLHTIVARPQIGFSPNYLGYCLNSDSFHTKMVPLLQGIKVLSINKSRLADIAFSFPSDKSEQRKIGEFFSQLDELIEAKEEEVAKLRQIKMALLDKMFPSDNQDAVNGGGYLIINELEKYSDLTMTTPSTNTPAIRFRGFTEPWRIVRIGDIASRPLDYGLNVAATKYDGIRKYLRITDIDDELHFFKKEDLSSPNLLDIARTYKLEEGDLVFARTGASVGKTYLYEKNDGEVYFAGFLIRARIKKTQSPYFVFTSTLTTAFSRFISITSQRTGQPGVNAQELEGYSMPCPSLVEQQKIGDFFRSHDETIINSQLQVNKLRTIRQVCLQQMFV